MATSILRGLALVFLTVALLLLFTDLFFPALNVGSRGVITALFGIFLMVVSFVTPKAEVAV